MSEEKKIIIDEDWKSQVEREKEELENAPPEEDASAAAGQIPAATFSTLVTSIGTQALMMLGQIADPASGQAIYHPDLARHHIDSLIVLQEKTKGNLSDEETTMLEQFITELRQIFVAMQSANLQATPTSASGLDDTSPSPS
jgi:hypothetical protein